MSHQYYKNTKKSKWQKQARWSVVGFEPPNISFWIDIPYLAAALEISTKSVGNSYSAKASGWNYEIIAERVTRRILYVGTPLRLFDYIRQYPSVFTLFLSTSLKRWLHSECTAWEKKRGLHREKVWEKRGFVWCYAWPRWVSYSQKAVVSTKKRRGRTEVCIHWG